MQRSTRVRCTNGRAIGRISEGPPGQTRLSVDRRGPGYQEDSLAHQTSIFRGSTFLSGRGHGVCQQLGLVSAAPSWKVPEVELLAPATANFRPGLVARIGIE